MFFRSPSGRFSPVSTSWVLLTLSASPVRALSLTCREKLSRIRPSAATRSPASSSKISPGTSARAGTSRVTPPRMTFAVGAAIACRLCSDFTALKCWTVPRTAFMTSTARMTIVLSRLPVTKEMTAVIIKIMTIRSLNWLKNTAKTPCRFSSASPLGPCFCSLTAASSAESPSRPVASCSITSRACRRS